MNGYQPPEFDLHELVILKQSSSPQARRILQRVYDPDVSQWMYALEGVDGLHLVSSIERHSDQVADYPPDWDDLEEEAAADEEVSILDWWEMPGGSSY